MSGESIPGALGETAQTYKVTHFNEGMTRLALLFTDHPELRWLQATTDPAGHVDIIVQADTGVLHSWVHALPSARREKGLFSIHSGAAFEEILHEGPLTVHVRPRTGGQS